MASAGRPKAAAVSRTQTISVMIVDDHPVVREGLRALLSRRPALKVVAEAGNGREAVEQSVLHKPDVALIDLRMPDVDGVEAMAAIRERSPGTRMIALTSFGGEEDVFRALRAGAKAYLLKDTPREQLLDCIRAVHEGRSWLAPAAAAKLATRFGTKPLSPRELDVLRLLVAGQTNKQIAGTLGIAEGTVKAHVSGVFQKLDVKTRAQAVAEALKRGFYDVERL
jgi:two-component system NarL family response regulator